MDNSIISKYTQIFDSLGLETKLELLSKLTESIQKGFKKREDKKPDLLNELAGSWSDVDDDIIEEIYASRSSSSSDLNMD
mgnify:CR=1 FL=1